MAAIHRFEGGTFGDAAYCAPRAEGGAGVSVRILDGASGHLRVRRARPIALGVLCLLLSLAGSSAAASGAEGFDLSGDFRTRLEADFDSRRADRTPRADRARLRIRARVALTVSATEAVSFGVRLRSGSDESHQSPHVTVLDFDDNDTGNAEFNLDKWFLRLAGDRGWGWVGRNSLPFWKQNEILWDDDVTVAGIAGGVVQRRSAGSLQIQGGYFSLPVGMSRFSGNLAAAQVVFARDDLTAALGALSFIADAGDPDATGLLSGNGSRDYSVFVGSVQKIFGPLTLGVDVMTNRTGYESNLSDQGAADRSDQTEGTVVSVIYGQTKEPGDWLAAVYLARVEALAVNSSYAGDDWVRWGSANETRASDLKGAELRFAYALRSHLDLVARLYLVESITTDEDGNRFRIDLNYSF